MEERRGPSEAEAVLPALRSNSLNSLDPNASSSSRPGALSRRHVIGRLASACFISISQVFQAPSGGVLSTTSKSLAADEFGVNTEHSRVYLLNVHSLRTVKGPFQLEIVGWLPGLPLVTAPRPIRVERSPDACGVAAVVEVYSWISEIVPVNTAGRGTSALQQK